MPPPPSQKKLHPDLGTSKSEKLSDFFYVSSYEDAFDRFFIKMQWIGFLSQTAEKKR